MGAKFMRYLPPIASFISILVASVAGASQPEPWQIWHQEPAGSIAEKALNLVEASTKKPPPKKQVQTSISAGLKQVKKATETVAGQAKAAGILQVAGHFDFGVNKAPRRADKKRKPRRRTPLFGGPT